MITMLVGGSIDMNLLKQQGNGTQLCNEEDMGTSQLS
jgi:hypothetical protein